MTHKIIYNPENPNGLKVELNAEEIAQAEADKITAQTEKTARANKETAKETLKASAKAKLIAGEKLTEDEANTIVL